MANGRSDVKLLDGQVKVEASDLCLDSRERRKNDTLFRRALVHDRGDGLTLNWAEDYPGGVTIMGKANMRDATINGEGQIRDLLARQVRMIGPLFALLTLTPERNINSPPSGITEQTFQATVGASFAQLLQEVQEGVTQEVNIKVDLIDAVATLSTLIVSLVDRMTLASEKTAQLSNDIEGVKAALASVDDNWRECSKCEGLFYAGHTTKGVCPAPAVAGSREHNPTGSPNYRLLK
jgi:hypothetical protein